MGGFSNKGSLIGFLVTFYVGELEKGRVNRMAGRVIANLVLA